jgi:predicted ribosome quality control (RQC) complex YloA/Tae2 family protein
MAQLKMRIDLKKNAQKNADDYYTKSKKLLQKVEGAKKAVADLEAKLKKLEAEARAKQESSSAARIKQRKKEWFESFHWFNTSGGFLVVGGRDATQNELLNSKHFDENDLFFHANIFGASVTILKNGEAATASDKEETAQFAASYSSAWKDMVGAVDVYAMKRGQVGKSSSGGYLSKGSFSLSGEREWYRNIELGLAMFHSDGRLNTIPLRALEKIKRNHDATGYAVISLGKDKKSEAAKAVSKMIGYADIDNIMQQLPAGTFRIVRG